MAYRRRYLSGQSATTVVIAEGAITSDKIVDKAVTQPKIDDDAVTTEKIQNESILSEDIKAGEVKTSDLDNGAVTTEKIADSAVTSDKLEESIREITRPLTPGIDTDEIQDAKVTLAKLAPDSVDVSKIKPGAVTASELNPDAVETVKIKNDAVTTDKIAGGAVTETKIGVNAVTGSKILNRSVGNLEIAVEGCHRENIKDLAINASKINPEAVTAAKLAENSVTEVKLATAALDKRHLSSKRARFNDVDERFPGGVLPDAWTAAIAAGGVVYPGGFFGLAIDTGALNNDDVIITSDYIGYILEGAPVFDTLVRHLQLTQRDTFIGVEDGGANRVGFECSAGVGGANWFARCDYADGAALVDTGIASDAATQDLLGFEVVDATTVKFYVDGILKATIVSTIPATTSVFPVIGLATTAAGGKQLRVRYFSLLGDRP